MGASLLAQPDIAIVSNPLPCIPHCNLSLINNRLNNAIVLQLAGSVYVR